MYEELSQRCQQLSDHLAAMEEQYAVLAESYGAHNSNSNSNGNSNSYTNNSSATSSVECVIYKGAVPPFKAETSTSQPLKRNQEVESWI